MYVQPYYIGLISMLVLPTNKWVGVLEFIKQTVLPLPGVYIPRFKILRVI